MSLFLRHRGLRWPIVLLGLISWLAISNHCAVTVLSAPPRVTESCPMHPKPAKQKENSGLVCCKILRAAAAAAIVKVAAPNEQLLTAGAEFAGALVWVSDLREPLVSALDTGPPPGGSFAESVLRRSLPAHAPPSLG